MVGKLLHRKLNIEQHQPTNSTATVKGQSKMDNPEKLATQDTQDEENKSTTQHASDITTHK
jgi:hypothetical protein